MVLLVVFLSLALGVSFFCSIAEAVLLSVRPGFIAVEKEKGSKAAMIWEGLKSDVETSLSAILSLNTIAHTIGAAGVGAQAAVVFGDSSLGVVSAVLTLLILVFSEIIPKTLGTYYWQQIYSPVGYCLRALVTIMRWLGIVWLSNSLTKLLTPKRLGSDFSRDEFKAIADAAAQQGHFDVQELAMLNNLLRLRETRVNDIMTPRPVISMFEEKLSVDELVDKLEEIPFSRLPVYKDDPDNITGFVLKRDILTAKIAGREGKRIGRFMRNMLSVAHTLDVYSAFQTMVSKGEHIALAVDEYGSVRGLLTLEDLLETLIGFEIVDEQDKQVDMQVLARDLWQKRAARKGIKFDDSETENVDKSEEP